MNGSLLVRAAAFGVALVVVSCARATSPSLPQGVMAGDPSADGVLVWGRCSTGRTFRVRLEGLGDREAPLQSTRDDAATIEIVGLRPATEYRYEADCVGGLAADSSIAGRFRTAPAPSDGRAVRFAWGGDLGGQNVCRDAERGYPVFEAVRKSRPDFFVALGDMIYGDGRCLARGAFGNAQVPGPAPADDRAGFRAHWRYNRSDPTFQRLLAEVPAYAIWDDHEVVNDFGAEAGLSPLLAEGRAAFLDYNPVRSVPSDPNRLYRRFRWGSHVELFILDTRQYRDPNRRIDSAAAPKTLLGRAQREWLVRGLAASDATWKVVVSSVPISIPTGSAARDGWAGAATGQGFERELRAILEELREKRVRGLLWITTDVHFATGFSYRPFPDDPGFRLWEFVSGPLNAGLAPNPALDSSFAPERLFFHGPPPVGMPASWDEALPWFNFGVVEIEPSGEARVRIVDATGETRAAVSLGRP